MRNAEGCVPYKYRPLVLLNIATERKRNMKNRTLKALLGACLAVMCLFVSAKFITAHASSQVPESAATVITQGGRLNVRKGATLSSGIITSIANKSTVTVYSVSDGWARVSFSNGKTGYCSTAYLNINSSSYPKKVSISSGYLNVRKGAGTSYTVKDYLYNGENVVVLSVNGNWARVVYHGNKTGYVHNSYLKAVSSSANTAKAVRLNVVDYKQTDSRWNWVTLGSSGKTLGRIGCTTTCLAMTESYRTGSTITPKAMASRLSYNSSGSLYWPSNYVTSVASSGYLAKIKSLLNSGKPVIVGFKKYSGTMHWVVVTGYVNSGTSTADFLINDPGSATRTTLAQFIAQYPVFYKIAYYS